MNRRLAITTGLLGLVVLTAGCDLEDPRTWVPGFMAPSRDSVTDPVVIAIGGQVIDAARNP